MKGCVKQFSWFAREHNSAILGFFTFFFAGRILYAYYAQISRALTNFFKSWQAQAALTISLISFFFISAYEGLLVQKMVDGTDPNNILKISNIIYTILFLFVLYRFRKNIKLTSLFKNKYVFLIYLIHPYFLFIGAQLATKLNARHVVQSGDFIPFDLLYAGIVLVLSLITTRLLLSFPIFNSFISGDLFEKKKSAINTEDVFDIHQPESFRHIKLPTQKS